MLEQANTVQRKKFISKVVSTKLENNYIVKWLLNSEKPKDSNSQHISKFTASEKELFYEGKDNYKKYCSSCHGSKGEGIANLAPPLKGSEWVVSKPSIPVSNLIAWYERPYFSEWKRLQASNGPMPGLKDNMSINDGTIAKILTFIRNAWGNEASPTTYRRSVWN
ncbi:MAG: cytochrome c [Saprospiraceae bacterium]|nr:cytochrome c [Saprospiraceae bacterium]